MNRINPITIGELEKLAVDKNNKLYWDGRPIVTEEKIKLQGWVNVSIIICSFSTLIYTIIEVLKFIGYENLLDIVPKLVH